MSCKEQPKETQTTTDVENTVEAEKAQEESNVSAERASNDQIANNIKNFLTQDYLKKELEFIEEKDRKFQYAEVDLNGDGKNEVFVRFMTSYFCGTGGCNFLLLSHEGDIITNFSVTRAPIWVEPAKENGWSILLVRNSGELKELKYVDGTYPSNPSMVNKAPYDAPSGHAVVLFDENYNPSKTNSF